MSEVVKWLLEGPAWIEYNTRISLLGQQEDELPAVSSRKAMLDDLYVKALVSELADWSGYELSGHKDANHALHKLAFIADIGLKAGDTDIQNIIARITGHRSPEGLYQILTRVPKHFGGSGEGMWTWMLCDAPLILYALVKFGLGEDAGVKDAVGFLTGLARENGWPCIVSPELGKFRGPGRKSDPCPYATLLMLKLLALLPEWKDSDICRTGAEVLLNLWEQSREQHPYMFYMGTDFRKLKAPLIWYDILHAAEVLTKFDWLKNDSRLLDMVSIIRGKADAQGCYTAESIWKAWGSWEFGQKKTPSRGITMIAHRIVNRMNA